MRKPDFTSPRNGLLALALSVGTVISAQTTFESSNNPAASLRIEQIDGGATVVHVRQSRASAAYVPVSQGTVLRDKLTGVACVLRSLDVEIDEQSQVEHYTLTFDPFLDEVTQFELLDPRNPNASLYFSRIDSGRMKKTNGITGAGF